MVNNQSSIKDIEETVVHIVKDWVRRFFNTVKTDGPHLGQVGVLFAEVFVLGILLSTNIQPQWGLATAVLNVALVPHSLPWVTLC